MTVLVEIRKLSKVYERGKEKIEVLHHVDLDIEKGDFLALMGPSGSGKTTLLNLVGGLDSPPEGTLAVAGKRIDNLGEGALAKWRASNVGFVFQFYNLLPMLSARKNVEVPLLLTRLGSAFVGLRRPDGRPGPAVGRGDPDTPATAQPRSR